MSDFAGNSLKADDGQPDMGWKDVLLEQAHFMRQFGVTPLSNNQVDVYEAALLERNISTLVEHKLWAQ